MNLNITLNPKSTKQNCSRRQTNFFFNYFSEKKDLAFHVNKFIRRKQDFLGR